MNDQFDVDEHSGDASGNGPSLFLILMIVVAAVAAIFVFQNREQATITFLFFDGEFRIWTAILFAILLGILLDRLLLMWWRRARRDRNE